MKYLSISMVLLVLFSCSCKKDGVGTRIDKNVGRTLWSFPLHKDDIFNSNSISLAHVLFDNHKILLNTTTGENQRWLTCIDVNDGTELWKWRDVFEEGESLGINSFYIYNNLFYYILGTRHYCINLQDGSTFWKHRVNRPYDSEIVGLGSDYIIRGNPEDTFQQYKSYVCFKGNIQQGNIAPLLIPNFTLNHVVGNRMGDATALHPYIENGDSMLLMVWQEVFPNWYFESYLSLYNISTDTYVYDKIQLNDSAQNGVIFHPIEVVGDLAYMNIANRIMCHRISTGEKIWDRPFPNDFMFSGFIVEDGRVIANCENSVLYGLDAETGATLWEGQGAGTSSYLKGRYLNGVVYFYGGSTGDIHAVDCETGETLWQVDDSKTPDGHLWKPDIYVVPGQNGEKGRVVLCTSMHAYCVEAIR
jgi:outer membrane protein assembly factor BamB